MVLAAPALAQQRPQHTQYVLNNYVANPAVGGIESYTDVRASFRSQWVGVEGAPQTVYLTVHGSIGKHGASSPRNTKPNRFGFASKSAYKMARPHQGMGAIVQVDKAGLLRASTLNGSYSYHLPLTRYFTLSSGISAGITHYSVDLAGADPINPNDPFLTGGNLTKTKLDLGVGLWLYTPDFYVGVSGANLVRSKQDVVAGDAPALSQQRHFYTTAGVRFQPHPDLALIPSMMMKMTATAAPTIDLNLRALYNQQVWLGLSYRHTDAWAAMAGVNVNHLIDVGYSYEMPTSDLNQVSVGSHELVVGLKLSNRRKVICPQWVW
jgi:type IX secretion system PorP/SprF family membrane protein